MTNRRYKSDTAKSIHESAVALQQIGAIDKATMRFFDETCVTQTPALKASQIKRIREKANVSQPVFALYLNTSASTVQKWEAGTKQPSGMALKLLSVANKHGLEILI